uniref:Uncharacterized protein n=1 Tax=viral metagenome TaxID=1070528 RepID=A0A6H2A382_9ZZZZ
MLLQNEIQAGEVYVYYSDVFFMNVNPSLWQLVELGTRNNNNKWENIKTGELVNYGNHVFITIERLKRMHENIDSLHYGDNSDYVAKAYNLVIEYEKSQEAV